MKFKKKYYKNITKR